MKLPRALVGMAQKGAATIHTMDRVGRSDVMQWTMLIAWQYGLRCGLMVGLPAGVILTVISWGVYVATV